MEQQELLTLIVVVLTVVTLSRDWVSPGTAMVSSVTVLLLLGIVDAGQAFSGFSNPAPITVAALYVLARGVDETGVLEPLLARTLGERPGRYRTLVRLLFPASAASAFLNNTPIVAMLTPQVGEWADRQGVSASRYLMPLSFAAILGGAATLIGTSTNLVVSGLMHSHGLEPIGMFEITLLGLPVAGAGLVLLLFLSPVLLPERRPARRDLDSQIREFVTRMRVDPGGALDGRTVAQADFRSLANVSLVEIERGEEIIVPVRPATLLRGGDCLTFVGRADEVVDLVATEGLHRAESREGAPFDRGRHSFFEVVIGASSPLLGRTLRFARFRNRYQAAVVAIHRAGRPVRARLDTVKLHLGDTLLLAADPDFAERWRGRGDFLLVSEIGEGPRTVSPTAWIVGLIAVGIILPPSLGLLPILHTSVAGALLLILTGVLTPEEARSAIDLDVIFVIAGAFGVGSAIEVSGLADRAAGGLLAVSSGLGPAGALLAVVLVTLLFTEVITNNAAAVILFPIALAVAAGLGAEPRAFLMAVAVAASCSFLTPIGYQTNTMVYGPGGYRFTDYARLGLPLTLTVVVVVVLLAPVVWPF
ncbi:MAG: SLC13 family permease [bacterium]